MEEKRTDYEESRWREKERTADIDYDGDGRTERQGDFDDRHDDRIETGEEIY